MSEAKSQTPLVAFLAGLGLFAVGVLFTTQVVLSQARPPGQATDGFTGATVELVRVAGVAPLLVAGAGLAILGAALAFSTGRVTWARHLLGCLGVATATGLLFGGFSVELGGRAGALLPGAIGGGAGGTGGAVGAIAGLIAGASVLAATLYLAWWPARPSISPKLREAGSVSTALREGDVDGVTSAEAAALLPAAGERPSEPPATAEQPSDVRRSGGVPEGALPLGVSQAAASHAAPPVDREAGSPQGPTEDAQHAWEAPAPQWAAGEPARPDLAERGAAGEAAPIARGEAGPAGAAEHQAPLSSGGAAPVAEPEASGGVLSIPLAQPSWESAQAESDAASSPPHAPEDDAVAEPEAAVGAGAADAPEVPAAPEASVEDVALEPEPALEDEVEDEVETAAAPVEPEAEEPAPAIPEPSWEREPSAAPVPGEFDWSAGETEDAAAPVADPQGSATGTADALAESEEDEWEDEEEAGDAEEYDEEEYEDEGDDEDGEWAEDEDDEEGEYEEEEDEDEDGDEWEYEYVDDETGEEGDDEDWEEDAEEDSAEDDAVAPEDEVVEAAAEPEPEPATDEPEVTLEPAGRPRGGRGRSTPRRGEAATPAPGTDVDEGLLYEAGLMILERERVAVSMLQREFKLDFEQSTKLLDALQERGLIGPYLGGRHRDILLTREEWESRIGSA